MLSLAAKIGPKHQIQETRLQNQIQSLEAGSARRGRKTLWMKLQSTNPRLMEPGLQHGSNLNFH
jgi:hypothetical protein